MKTYSVKIERTVYSDKNYIVEADGELEASDIAVQLAEDEWNNTLRKVRLGIFKLYFEYLKKERVYH